MTLFGLVLATGLLVDDAIVVVENVERLMDENPEMTPREATIASMEQIQMALVAIALVLSAVFLPMVFFGGSTGVIYRQFSATIVSAMALSVFIALTLSPAIAANLLHHSHATVEETWVGRKAPRARACARDGPHQVQRRLRPAARLVRPVGGSRGRAQMAVPRDLRRRLPGARLALLPASDRLLADRGPGRRFGSIPLARRSDHDPHAAKSSSRSKTIS